jgi:tyrosinase
MAQYTRSNAWNNGGTFNNTDLLWYAKGVGLMMTRQLNDPSSWWFYAAIHGEYLNEPGFPGWGSIPAPPAVPTTPVPPPNVQQTYWDQCQHQSWYFPPWHRGYLIALEAQIRAAVISLNGPASWALPYWDYLAPNQDAIPPAFTQPALPDGTRNALYVAARYGPNNDGNIFIPEPPVNQACMSNTIYTGSDANTPAPGFGGRQTGFWHGGGQSGNLESNPHNLVHVFTGGDEGIMSYPGTAAIDPIFYLHHCNIDRMWAVWNETNSNPDNNPNWSKGPANNGQNQFIMPMPDGTAWVFQPSDVTSLSQVSYTYDTMQPAAPVPAPYGLTQRLTRLGAPAEAARVTAGASMNTKTELMGASATAIPIKGDGVTTSVKLDPTVRRKVSASLTEASAAAPPDRVYLSLENVRGTRDGTALSVYVNLPEDANPADHPDHLAGAVGLFGLRTATLADREHAGGGLNFTLDITKIVDTLHLENALDADSLQVRIVPYQTLPDQAEITVGRVGVYREGL